MNIASLSVHIDDLEWLPDTLDHKFDTIGVTESKIKESVKPLNNIEIQGCEFKQTPTKSDFWGVGLFIKKGLNYKIRSDLSKSIYKVYKASLSLWSLLISRVAIY